jgi:hypothetical protein
VTPSVVEFRALARRDDARGDIPPIQKRFSGIVIDEPFKVTDRYKP